jgi:hypothetical protein
MANEKHGVHVSEAERKQLFAMISNGHNKSVGQAASLFAWFVRAHHIRERMVGALTMHLLCLFGVQIAHFETQYGIVSSKLANIPKPPIQPQARNRLLFLDQPMLFLCDSTVMSL